jgi:hypothetical protein
LYVDGTLAQSTADTACQNFTGWWRIGSYSNSGWTAGANGYFAGTVDEVRISNAARSATWIATEWNNQNSPSTFYSLDIAQRQPCTGGGLALTTPSSFAWAVTLDGTNQTAAAALVVTPDDETTSAVGWNITATSTTFTNAASKTLATTATTLTTSAAVAATGNCSLPTNSIAYPVTLPAATTAPTAVKLYNAAVGTGRGPTTVTLNFSFSAPGNIFGGSYVSTWTIGIVSGP